MAPKSNFIHTFLLNNRFGCKKKTRKYAIHNNLGTSANFQIQYCTLVQHLGSSKCYSIISSHFQYYNNKTRYLCNNNIANCRNMDSDDNQGCSVRKQKAVINVLQSKPTVTIVS